MTERSLEIFGRFILGKEQAFLANVIPHHERQICCNRSSETRACKENQTRLVAKEKANEF